jgi:D-alanine-D-alanine ligase
LRVAVAVDPLEERGDAARAVTAALIERCETCVVPADSEFLAAIRGAKPDIVFNLSSGVRGESRQSQVPAMLEMVGIPYTGSGVLAHALALDKAAAKKVMSYYGIATPKFRTILTGPEELDGWDTFPAIVKPGREGSGMGIHRDSLVRTAAEAVAQVERVRTEFGLPVVVEEFIEGAEFTVGVMGNPPCVRALPPLLIDFSELPPETGRFYTYEVKKDFGESTKYLCPAPISPELRTALEAAACGAFMSIGCRDVARVDIRERGGQPYVIEINSLPGMRPDYSDLPKVALAAGMDYPTLVRRILSLACRRTGLVSPFDLPDVGQQGL